MRISSGVGLFCGGTQRHRIGDTAIDELEAVVRPLVIDPEREALREQSFVEQVSSPIACEGAPRSVGAAQTRREADDQQARVVGPKAVDGRVMPERLTQPRLFAESDEARAQRAIA